MSRKIKVACAQTGPVDSEEMSSMVPKACQMLEDAAAEGVNILTFCELFLSPFFPNRLEENFDHFFTSADSKEMKKIRDTARKVGVAMVLPFGERANTGMYNAALVTNAAGE